jgi:hypothetical protein
MFQCPDHRLYSQHNQHHMLDHTDQLHNLRRSKVLGVDGYCLNGCNNGWYGATCSISCNNDIHCIVNASDRHSGQCTGNCVNGWYGNRCNLKCSANCRRTLITTCLPIPTIITSAITNTIVLVTNVARGCRSRQETVSTTWLSTVIAMVTRFT